jgi:hypothetical protein
MTILCKKFFPTELELLGGKLAHPLQTSLRGGDEEDASEEEEPEED